ncbi:MAG: carboxylesterase family protein [Lachnospiraceae bacterium]|nr:carboxylesterase family protein [Lachnospiraceae bacterium]
MALLEAMTKYGPVKGVPGNDPHTTVFRGIPYAKPPVGELRFAPPQEPESWSEVLECAKFRNACIQFERRRSNGPIFYKTSSPRECAREVSQSEDCLYLDIYTPALSVGDKLPVMVWIYGGGFNSGYSFHPAYDGEEINRKGCILVTINYRCNVMGFLALDGVASGNMGMLDQVLALKWVQENITSFGGDKDNVLIFVQSAGGMSTKFHLVSPLSRGLFHKAIIHSGGGLNGADPTRPVEELKEISQKCLDILGWTKEDLMTRDASEISVCMGDTAEDMLKDNKELFVFQPCIDGVYLTEIPEISLKEGKMADVDVIDCTVEGDSWMFSRKVRDQLMDRPEVLRAFSYASTQSLARSQNRIGGKSIRTFYWERHVPGDHRGAPHGCDLQYMFGTLSRFERPWTSYDLELSYL